MVKILRFSRKTYEDDTLLYMKNETYDWTYFYLQDIL